MCTVALRAGWRRSSAAAASPRSPTPSASRSPPPTARCRTPRPVRACCARCCRGCARTPAPCARGSRCCARASRPASRRPASPGRATSGSTCPRRPRTRVYIFRDADGHPLYVGKSVCLRTRARAHFHHPVELDRPGRARRLPAGGVRASALVLENRLIKALRPPGNKLLKKEADGYVYLRCRLDIPFPILEVAREPHGSGTPSASAWCAPRRPPSWSSSSTRCSACGTAGARSPGASTPSAYGQMGRCPSPAWRPRPELYRERLDGALGLFEVDGGAALLEHVDAQMSAASRARRYERAAWLRRRRKRLEALLSRLGGVLRASHAGCPARARAAHPAAPGCADAFWIVAGRIAGLGPAPRRPE